MRLPHNKKHKGKGEHGMLKIKFGRQEQQLYFEAQGHAGCGARGQDVVCAGASMLAQTLRAALSQAEQAGAGRLIRSELRAGWGKIRFMPRGGDGRAAQVFATVRAGFALLAEAMPQAVQMEGDIF